MTSRLDPIRWLGLPALLCALASLLLAMPIRVLGLQLPEPVFAMAPAFAWAVIRPSILPPFVLLALGAFLDILWGAPVGLWPLVLLTLYAPVLAARPFLIGQDFAVLWGWYVAACALAFGTGYAIVAARYGVAPNLVGLGWQFLATAALFPLSWRLIERYEDADVRFR